MGRGLGHLGGRALREAMAAGQQQKTDETGVQLAMCQSLCHLWEDGV